MGYEGFRPEVLAKELMTDRNRDCVFKNLCYKGPILGEITKKGDVLHIAGVGRPTVRDYTPGDRYTRDKLKEIAILDMEEDMWIDHVFKCSDGYIAIVKQS